MPRWLGHTILAIALMVLVVTVVGAKQSSDRNSDLHEINESVRIIRNVAEQVSTDSVDGSAQNSAVAATLQEVHNLCLLLQQDAPELECPGGQQGG